MLPTRRSGVHSAGARWRTALEKVRQGLLLTTKLDTLRDMTSDNHIEESELTRVKEIGEGAFATVDICKYTPPTGGEALVAVKRLKPNILNNKEELLSFVEETKLLRKLQHRNITGYIGVGGQLDGSLHDAEQAKKVLNSTFLVQEFIDGGNLRKQVLQQMCTNHLRKKHYTHAQALQWAIQIARGLKYLHTSKPKIVWRDAKLENILMRKVNNGKDLEACLADFGLSVVLPTPHTHNGAKLRECVKLHRPTGDALIDTLSQSLDDILKGHELHAEDPTQAGPEDSFDLTGKTGSFFYMAPEVVNEQRYNEKAVPADVFAFGVIMYELFVGEITSQVIVGPTGNVKAAEIYAAKVAAGYRRPLPNFLPEQLRDLISACWAQDMTHRPDMVVVLERLKEIDRMGIISGKNGQAKAAAGAKSGSPAAKSGKGVPGKKKGCAIM